MWEPPALIHCTAQSLNEKHQLQKKIEATKTELPESIVMVSLNKNYSILKVCHIVTVYSNLISLNLQFYLQVLSKQIWL